MGNKVWSALSRQTIAEIFQTAIRQNGFTLSAVDAGVMADDIMRENPDDFMLAGGHKVRDKLRELQELKDREVYVPTWTLHVFPEALEEIKKICPRWVIKTDYEEVSARRTQEGKPLLAYAPIAQAGFRHIMTSPDGEVCK